MKSSYAQSQRCREEIEETERIEGIGGQAATIMRGLDNWPVYRANEALDIQPHCYLEARRNRFVILSGTVTQARECTSHWGNVEFMHSAAQVCTSSPLNTRNLPAFQSIYP